MQLIFRPVDAIIVREAQGDPEGLRRLVSGSYENILEAVERVADLFHTNGLAEAMA
jgi:hypothetical protein